MSGLPVLAGAPRCRSALIRTASSGARSWHSHGHAGQRGQRRVHAIVSCSRVLQLWKQLLWHRHAQRQHARRVETRLRAQQPLEAAYDECAGAEQDDRQSATCMTTIARRRLFRPPPRTDALRSSDASVDRDAQNAGASPATTPSSAPTPIRPRRRASRRRSIRAAAGRAVRARRVRAFPRRRRAMRRHHRARRGATPREAWRASSAPPFAPSARDTANSRSRFTARASSSVARFTITSTRNTPATPRTMSAGRTPATRSGSRPTE